MCQPLGVQSCSPRGAYPHGNVGHFGPLHSHELLPSCRVSRPAFPKCIEVAEVACCSVTRRPSAALQHLNVQSHPIPCLKRHAELSYAVLWLWNAKAQSENMTSLEAGPTHSVDSRKHWSHQAAGSATRLTRSFSTSALVPFLPSAASLCHDGP